VLQIRAVKTIGMWPVGLVTHYGISTPVVKNGKITSFYDGWVANRKFPVDMASFAFSVKLLLQVIDFYDIPILSILYFHRLFIVGKKHTYACTLLRFRFHYNSPTKMAKDFQDDQIFSNI